MNWSLKSLPNELLYQVRDSSRMVHLVKHGKNQWTLSVVNRTEDKTQLVFAGIARDTSRFNDPRQFAVDGSDHPLFLFSANLDTGSWKELGTNCTLEAVLIDNYAIETAPTAGQSPSRPRAS